MENYLLRLTKEDILTGSLPLDKILDDSLYYPASGLDFGLIKICNTDVRNYGIVNFIYCDYFLGENFSAASESMPGYSVLARRIVTEEELPPGVFNLPDFYSGNKELDDAIERIRGKKLCQWVVYERNSECDEGVGPKRFSILFVYAEGVTVYRCLYITNKKVPRILAIIQSGTGFGGNWTDFRRYDMPLASTLRNNPAGMPDTIFYGGHCEKNRCSDYNDLNWAGYEKTDCVYVDYYSPGSGCVVVYKKSPK